MYHSTSNAIIVFAAGLSLLTAVGQLFLKDRRDENINLFVLFFLLGTVLLQAYSVLTGFINTCPAIFFLNMTSISLLAPIFFRAYYYVVFPVHTFPIKQYLIFASTVIVFLVDLYFISLPDTEKLIIIQSVLHGNPSRSSYLMLYTYLLSAVQMIFFTIYLVKVLLKETKNYIDGAVIYLDIIYTILSMLTYCTIAMAIFLGSLHYIRIGAFAAALLLIGAYLAGFRYPEFLQLFFIKSMTNKSSRPLVALSQMPVIQSSLQGLMERDKIYRDEELTLQSLAKKLSLSIHQLSHILNETYNMNFNSYVNQYRVEEARKMLVENPCESILSIAHEVGFNSKSAFYAAFSRFTGMTPTVYRKENQSRRYN